MELVRNYKFSTAELNKGISIIKDLNQDDTTPSCVDLEEEFWLVKSSFYVKKR